MPLRADDEMVVDGDAQRLAGGGDLPRQVDIGAAGAMVAARMVVDHPNGRCNQLILLVKSAPWMQVEPLIGGGPR